ncbi:MAG TPA: ABC transporter substrate-binding protein [Chitinophagaceae bacterium]|nr:ABC transporter substrate-binding protein [Chitinophagaceae bacterium]
MKLCRIFFFCLLLLSVINNGYAQSKQYQVAMFVPLYLDSAFDATDTYRYGKTFPRQSISALEFYIGAEFALDSLAKEGRNLKVHILDIRSNATSIASMASNPLMDSIDLIIGPVTGSDYLQLANLAQQKQIPFVSASYPNDGGIKNNPYVLIANAKLNTHLQSLYNYVLRNLGTSRIIYARRKNPADDRIGDIFKSLNQSASGQVMKMETLILPDAVTPQDLAAKLDSSRENVIIAGSVDENFGRNLAVAALGNSKTFAITMVGMPTWEGIKDLQRNEFKTLPIIFSNSFFDNGEAWSHSFEEAYKRKTFSKPTDLAFKGFELVWYFSGLLSKYDSSFMQHLDDNSFNILTDYDFRPIQWNKAGGGPDYYENKRVYIIKRLNGITTRLN